MVKNIDDRESNRNIIRCVTKLLEQMHPTMKRASKSKCQKSNTRDERAPESAKGAKVAEGAEGAEGAKGAKGAQGAKEVPQGAERVHVR